MPQGKMPRTITEAPRASKWKRLSSIFTKPRYGEWQKRKARQAFNYKTWIGNRKQFGVRQGLHVEREFKKTISTYEHLKYMLSTFKLENTVSMEVVQELQRAGEKDPDSSVLFSKLFMKRWLQGERSEKGAFTEIQRFQRNKRLATVGKLGTSLFGGEMVGTAFELSSAFSGKGETARLDFERPFQYLLDLMRISKKPTYTNIRAAKRELEPAIHAAEVSLERMYRAYLQFLRLENRYRKQKGLPPLEKPTEKDWWSGFE